MTVNSKPKKVCDRFGNEIKEGDKIQFYYVTPLGRITDDLMEGEKEVIFAYGSLGIESECVGFTPLFELIDKTENKNEHIPLFGNPIIIDKDARSSNIKLVEK